MLSPESAQFTNAKYTSKYSWLTLLVVVFCEEPFEAPVLATATTVQQPPAPETKPLPPLAVPGRTWGCRISGLITNEKQPKKLKVVELSFLLLGRIQGVGQGFSSPIHTGSWRPQKWFVELTIVSQTLQVCLVFPLLYFKDGGYKTFF